MPDDFLGLFVPDQQIRVLNPEGRTASKELLEFLRSPGRDPFKQREPEQRPVEPEPEFDDYRWPVKPNRWKFLSDANINRLCVTELGGVGKSKLVEELEYLTAKLHPDHIIMRFNLAALPVSPRQLLTENMPGLNNSLLVERFKNNAHSASPANEFDLGFDVKSLILNHLQRGKFTWIIDGIDQVGEAEARTQMEKVVSQFLQWYPRIRCVIAGRPYSIQRIWDGGALGSTRNGNPVWKFCILERFTIGTNDERPSQAQRYLPLNIWEAVQQLEAAELSLPRTLNILRQMNESDAREARTASEIYWRVIHRSTKDSLEVVRARRNDIRIEDAELMMMLGTISLSMMVCFDSPVTEVVGETDVKKFLRFIKSSGLWDRFDTESLLSDMKFSDAFKQLPLLGESSIRFHAHPGVESGPPVHLEITDTTIRDFYAAWFAGKYLDDEFDAKLADQFRDTFNTRQAKIFSYPEATSFGQDYARYWKLLVEMPRQVGGEETSSNSSFARMVRPVLMSRNSLRPTEMMYRLWPELLLRGGYLTTKQFGERDLQNATTMVQHEAWKRIFPKQHFDGAVAIDLSCPIKTLLFDFLGEYPRCYRDELESVQLKGIVTWFENGFRDVPSGEVHYGDGDETRTIEVPFQLNKYQTSNDIYSLFDPLHWQATKKDEETTSVSFGNSKSYSPNEKSPATRLTWFDGWAFATWIGGRLPHEVEWEAAARGTIGELSSPRSRYYFGGNVEDTETAAGLKHYACYRKNAEGVTCDVDSFGARPESISAELMWKEHPYGLLNMHGNVWEWCANRRVSDSLSRVVRGGSFVSGAEDCTSSFRFIYDPAYAHVNDGLRVARVPRKILLP